MAAFYSTWYGRAAKPGDLPSTDEEWKRLFDSFVSFDCDDGVTWKGFKVFLEAAEVTHKIP